MRESRTDRGQKFGCRQKPGFCTVDAVDMQALVHRTLALRSWLSGVELVGNLDLLRTFASAFFFFGKRV